MREFRRYHNDDRQHRKHNRSHVKYGRSNNHDHMRNDMERNSHARVKISNLEYTINKENLMELFTNVCKVVNVWINYDHTDRSDLGTAVCIFESIEDAQKAIDKYD
ncbi:hypothetical protein, partial [Plasmodium yoelii yoelii]